MPKGMYAESIELWSISEMLFKFTFNALLYNHIQLEKYHKIHNSWKNVPLLFSIFKIAEICI